MYAYTACQCVIFISVMCYMYQQAGKRTRVLHVMELKLFMVLRRLVRLLFSNVQRSCAYTGAEFQAREL